MSTLYTLITGFSIVGIKYVDVILSFIFDSIAFTLAWKIGGFGDHTPVEVYYTGSVV